MDFFGIGFGEILLIIVIALIIFGPGKLPEIARTLGRMSRSLRKATSDFTASLTKEIDVIEKDRPSPPKAISQNKSDEPSDKPKVTDSNQPTEIEK